MNRVRRIYLFAVLGAFGGLVSAALHQWLFLPLWANVHNEPQRWAMEALLGVLIGGPIGFFPRISEAWSRSSPREGLRAGLVAAGIAAAGGLVAVPAGEWFHQALQGGYLGRACSVGLLGLALGLAEMVAGGARQWRALAGGLGGGLIAGVVLEFLVRTPKTDPDSAIRALILLGLLISLSVAFFIHVRPEVWLEGLYGSKVYQQVYHLTRFREPAEAVIGSEGKVFLWLAEAQPRHASLTITGRGTLLKHIAAAGETYVNDQPVQERILKDGDVIRIAHIRLRYLERRSPATVAERPRVRFQGDAKARAI